MLAEVLHLHCFGQNLCMQYTVLAWKASQWQHFTALDLQTATVATAGCTAFTPAPTPEYVVSTPPLVPLLFIDRHGSFSLCDLTTTPPLVCQQLQQPNSSTTFFTDLPCQGWDVTCNLSRTHTLRHRGTPLSNTSAGCSCMLLALFPLGEHAKSRESLTVKCARCCVCCQCYDSCASLLLLPNETAAA